MVTHTTTSVAERFVFGRLQDPTRDPPLVHVANRPATALLGRLLLGTIFLVSGFAKVTDTSGTVAHMTGAGIPYPEALVWVAAAAEIFGGLSLVLGFLTRIGALGLILFLIPTTLTFHAFWNFSGAERLPQMVSFLKNLAIGGGLSLLVAYGPGRYSLDYKLRKPLEP